MLIKPLPTLDNAYSMITQVEDQRHLNDSLQDGRNLMTMNVGRQPFVSQPQPQSTGSKQGYQKQNNGPLKKKLSKE